MDVVVESSDIDASETGKYQRKLDFGKNLSRENCGLITPLVYTKMIGSANDLN
jgi:hypothetical protein